jgi:molybdopterin-guanine dinucleotide biosynthesis protein A
MAEEPLSDSQHDRARVGRPPGEPVTGIVLAGGHSRRMGHDKAFLELDGRPLIEIVLGRVQRACDEVLIVAAEVEPYRRFGVPVVTDIYRGVGVLGGIHAGLSAASSEICVVVGCDMPFLVPDLVRAFAHWAVGVDVVVLRQGEYTEPLHGAYRRTCLAPIEDCIRAGLRRIVSFFPQVRVRYVTPSEVASFDPGLSFIRNVNTPEQWADVQAEWAERKPAGTRSPGSYCSGAPRCGPRASRSWQLLTR